MARRTKRKEKKRKSRDNRKLGDWELIANKWESRKKNSRVGETGDPPLGVRRWNFLKKEKVAIW